MSALLSSKTGLPAKNRPVRKITKRDYCSALFFFFPTQTYASERRRSANAISPPILPIENLAEKSIFSSRAASAARIIPISPSPAISPDV